MPILYIIAGPTGVGKSTNGRDFVPEQVEILDHDKIEAAYKRTNTPHYQQWANQEMWRLIHETVAHNTDFGIELNLGTEEQYGLLRKIHGSCQHYSIHVILFYSAQSQLCLLRASVRALEGGHFVEPTMIDYMHLQTFSLLKQNSSTINHLTLIDVTYNTVELVYAGFHPDKHQYIRPVLPTWVTKNFPKIPITP